jgi:hypothetical protein
MSEITLTKKGETHERYERAMQDEAFETIRNHPILETRPEHFLKVLRSGTVSTNIYLRRVHNFALDMNWLPWPVLNKKQWPAIAFGEKRGVISQEHEAIIGIEWNAERKAIFDWCKAQGDSLGFPSQS